ncbi:MAG: hypothetical protein L6N96_04595, partial [Candidatus Methylarchaceae archaeon HK02M2]|nr:hypothetical protein [Candidatus Methylarchaceae archaeon HK02M2]
MRKENREFLYKKALNILIVLSFAILLLNIPIKPVVASTSDNSEVTIFYEDFEGVFPDDNDWSVADLDSNNGDDHWGASDYRAYGGTYSGWCAQVGERSGWTQIFREDFEEGFGDGINGWSVDDENPTGLDSYWDDVDSDFGGEGTSSGNYKAYCAGNGYLGTEISPSYRNYMDASMSRTLNLTDFDNADIAFYHKLISADVPWDYGQVLINDVEVKKYDSQQLTWDYEQISLLAYAGDVIEVTWNFHSDSADTYEGWYLDEILFFGNAPVDTPNSELHNYDLYMEAIMEMKEIDLSDYTSANLSYYYWMNIETGWDYLYVETSPDGL